MSTIGGLTPIIGISDAAPLLLVEPRPIDINENNALKNSNNNNNTNFITPTNLNLASSPSIQFSVNTLKQNSLVLTNLSTVSFVINIYKLFYIK